MADVTRELRTPLTVPLVKTTSMRMEVRSAGKDQGSTFAVVLPMELPE